MIPNRSRAIIGICARPSIAPLSLFKIALRQTTPATAPAYGAKILMVLSIANFGESFLPANKEMAQRADIAAIASVITFGPKRPTTKGANDVPMRLSMVAAKPTASKTFPAPIEAALNCSQKIANKTSPLFYSGSNKFEV